MEKFESNATHELDRSKFLINWKKNDKRTDKDGHHGSWNGTHVACTGVITQEEGEMSWEGEILIENVKKTLDEILFFVEIRSLVSNF